LTAADGAGNALASTPGGVFTIDSTAPTVESLVYSKGTRYYKAETFTVTAIFSEDITPGSASITITGGNLGGSVVTNTTMLQGANRRTWSLTRTIQAGDPNVTRTITVGGSDAAGNAATVMPSNDTFDIDTVVPTITSLVYDKSPNHYSKDQAVVITVTFSEDITPTDPTISISGGFVGGSGVSGVALTQKADRRTWTFERTVSASDPDGVRTVTISASDPGGNAVASTPNNSFTLDSTAPGYSSVVYSKSPNHYKGGETLTVTVTFTEAITPTNPTISISGGTVGLSTISNAALTQGSSRSIWIYTRAVNGSDASGTRTISYDAQDAAGNAAGTPTIAQFTIDNVVPTISSLTYNKASQLYRAESFVVTATFSEDVTPNAPTITIITGNVGGSAVSGTAMAQAGSRQVWTFSTTILTGNPNGGRTVTVAGSDAAGNAVASTPNNAFTIDTAAPTATLAFSKVNRVYSSETFAVTATFNEDISPSAPTIAIAGGTGGGQNDVSATAMTQGASRSIWTYSRSVSNSDEGNFTITLAGTDAAGNSTTQPPVRTFTIDTVAPSEATVTNTCYTSPCQCLKWSAVSDSGSAIRQYKIYRSTSTSAFTDSDLFMTVDASQLDLKFEDPTNTRYGVGAVDDAGNATPASSIARIVNVSGGCTACDNLCVAAPDGADPTATLTFSDADRNYKAGSFTVTATFSEAITPLARIQITGGGGSSNNDVAAQNMTPTGNPWVFTLTRTIVTGDDGPFTITLTGTDVDGNALSAQPVVRTFTIDTTAPAAATLTGDSFSNPNQCLKWTAVTDAVSGISLYKVYGSTTSTGTYTLMTSTTGTSVTFNDPSNIFYKVIPVDGAGNELSLGSVTGTSLSSVSGACP
ncbi:MAG: hypothetical protein HY816_12390, partial [Candidatus Wallbacteria bacterium]|nr:hypothetical protein [Candidatus Wallbacteria bacterium]